MTDRVELAVRELVDAIKADLVPPPEPSALVDLSTAAQLLGVSRTSLYQLMDSGQLQNRKIGRRRLVPRAELERFAIRSTPTQKQTAPVIVTSGTVKEVSRGDGITPS